MEKHPEIDICAHAATVIRAFNGKFFDYIKPSNVSTIFEASVVINGGGGFVATNSLFYRKKLNFNIPKFRLFYPLDYTLQIQGSLKGGMLYLYDNMSVYRAFVANSWSDRMKNYDLRKRHHDKMIKMYQLLNTYTKNKFSDIIKEKIFEEEFLSMENTREYSLLETSGLKDWYSKKPIKWKLKKMVKRYAPYIVELYKDIKLRY